MSDIDILVRPNDLKQAILLLQQLGFKSPSRTLEFMKRGEMTLRVDLHDRLWFFDAQKLWQQVRPKKAGSPLMVLPPEYALLHVALHTLLQDGFVSQTALQDGAALLHYYRGEWDWERFAALAREEGWSRTAAVYLRQLEKMESEDPLICPAGNSYSRMLRAQERVGKKIKLFWFILFPSFGFLKWRYSFIPSFFYWLLPLVRCVDLAWKGVLTYFHAETKR